jgi:hypothetical protein
MQSFVVGLALQRQKDEWPVLLGSKRNRQEVRAAASGSCTAVVYTRNKCRNRADMVVVGAYVLGKVTMV